MDEAQHQGPANKSAIIGTRLTPGRRRELADAARRDGMRQSEWVRLAIEERLRRAAGAAS